MSFLLGSPKFQGFDNNGNPLSGGKLYSYVTGTTTPKSTYSDYDLQTANANPTILNSRGEATIYLEGATKLVLKDSNNVTIWTFDNIGTAAYTTLADEATPSILGGSLFLTGGTTTITDFDDGTTGQQITILSDHTITITHGTNIILSNSQNFGMVANDSLTLVLKADNKWYEVARGTNTFESNTITTLANEATPSVLSNTIFKTGGTTTITDFDDGVTGQIIQVLFEHTVQVNDGTNIFLDGSINNPFASTDSLTLVCKSDNKWYEIGRSINSYTAPTYTITNDTQTRTLDCDATTTDELADVIGTLILDLQTKGILEA